MEISIFLAKFFGLYIVLTTLPMLVSPQLTRERYEGFLSNDPVMKLAGIFTLILGAFLVVLHNIWVPNWRLVVTLICWLVLIEGISIVYFPHHARSLFRRIAQKPPMLTTGAIGLAIGLFLIFMGFFKMHG